MGSSCIIIDSNSNVTRVEVGPCTLTLKDHEKVVMAPEPMVMIPPRHYCIIANPAQRDADGAVVCDEHGSTKIRHGDEEVRFTQAPFPLHPGEKLFGKVAPLQVVGPNQALRLRCIRDFTDDVTKSKDGKSIDRVAGDEWLFEVSCLII